MAAIRLGAEIDPGDETFDISHCLEKIKEVRPDEGIFEKEINYPEPILDLV